MPCVSCRQKSAIIEMHEAANRDMGEKLMNFIRTCRCQQLEHEKEDLVKAMHDSNRAVMTLEERVMILETENGHLQKQVKLNAHMYEKTTNDLNSDFSKQEQTWKRERDLLRGQIVTLEQKITQLRHVEDSADRLEDQLKVTVEVLESERKRHKEQISATSRTYQKKIDDLILEREQVNYIGKLSGQK
eukprot:Clim_evm49s229 gene=Clim_evmTU49s229